MMGVFQPLAADAFDDVGDGSGGVVVVDGDADDLGAGAGEGGDLLDGGLDVGGVGVGHGLDDDGGVGAYGDGTDFDRNGGTAVYLWHRFSVSKFTSCGLRPPRGWGWSVRVRLVRGGCAERPCPPVRDRAVELGAPRWARATGFFRGEFLWRRSHLRRRACRL